jgi:hypothetical protein
MGLRAQLMQAVASCATKQTQHATFKESDATGSATEAQQNTANPHEIRVSGATGSATATQQGQKDSATHAQNDEQLRVAFARTRNSQLSSLTAHRLAKEVIAAAMKRCDEYGDSDQARTQMRRDCLATPKHLQQDLLDHFNGKPVHFD